jgi:hypothetical protein
VYILDQEYSGLYNEDIWECIECYLNLPDTPDPNENPLNIAHFCELQQQDKQLLALQVKYLDNYANLQLDDNIDDITCYKKDPTNPIRKLRCPNQWWAQGAPQLFATTAVHLTEQVLLVRYELITSRSLS